MKHYLLLVAAWLLVGLRPALGADHNGANEDPPVIDIALTPNRSSTTADFLVYDGESLSFDGSGSYDPDGGALTKHDWTINYTSGKPKDYAGVVFDTSYALANGSMQTMRLLIRDDENNYVSKTVTIEVVAAPVVEWERTYFIRDHLGSVRVAFNEDGDVVEATDYYPFGLQMPTRSFVAGSGVKENFTGHEFDSGIGLLYAGARYLDPATGRWLTVDPRSDDAMQVDKSPYAYAWNNPTNITDPDGECPWCIGAIVGAAVEFGSQVAARMANGESFSGAAGNVDYVDVGIAAGVGAATGGFSTIRSVGAIAKTGIAVAGSVGEEAAKANLGSQTSEYGLTEVFLDASMAGAVRRVADAGQTVAQGTQQARQLRNQARRAENIAAAGRPRAGQMRRAQQARARADSFGRGSAAQFVQAGTQSAVRSVAGTISSGGNRGGRSRGVVTGKGGVAPADNTRVVIRFREEQR